MIYCFRLGSISELLWYPLMIIDLRLIDLLKKILHKSGVNLNEVLDLVAATSWGVVVGDLWNKVFTRSPSEPIYHRVGWGGDVIFGWKDNSHRSDIDTHTHNTHRANTTSRFQWYMAILSDPLPFAATEMGGVMVKFYSIYQICSPFSGWCIITTRVSSSVLWFS